MISISSTSSSFIGAIQVEPEIAFYSHASRQNDKSDKIKLNKTKTEYTVYAIYIYVICTIYIYGIAKAKEKAYLSL